MMKKIACMFTVLCLTVMLAACGGKSDGGGSAQTPSAERDSKTGISAEPSDPENIVPEMEESAIPADTASEAEESSDLADTASEAEESPADQGTKGRLLYMGHASIRITTPEGKVIMGRNFDFKDARCLVVWTHPENGYRSMAVCNQNLMMYADVRRSRRGLRALGAPYTSMDGVNEKGLACAILELLGKPTKQQTGKTPITTSVALRGVLDNCATVDEAVEFMKKYDMHDLLGACYHYFFTDETGQSAIVEYMDHEMYVYRQEKPDESLKLTNFYITPGGKCREKGRDRYEKMECALHESPVMSENDAMDVLRSCEVYFRSKYKVFMIGTLWSAVYNCTDRSMLLCAGRDYSNKYRLQLDKPCEAERAE
jgi:hypothetical protein